MDLGLTDVSKISKHFQKIVNNFFNFAHAKTLKHDRRRKTECQNH